MAAPDDMLDFEGINDRLKAIIAAVDDEDLPLDNALDLLEEAVGLGMQASSLLEEGIAAGNAAGVSDDAPRSVSSFDPESDAEPLDAPAGAGE